MQKIENSHSYSSLALFVSTTSSSNPAPLELCFHPMFDLQNDKNLCPTERNALRDFYYSTKGGEWTDSANWTDPYISHCFWKGISCANDGAVTILNLTNDGLSGTLSKSIANLSSLEILELSDNDIKVSVTVSLKSFLHMNACTSHTNHL